MTNGGCPKEESALDEKKALLVVSFGTSHHDTREKTIDRIEAYLAGAFPDRRVYRAWTSGMIIRKLRQEGWRSTPCLPPWSGCWPMG